MRPGPAGLRLPAVLAAALAVCLSVRAGAVARAQEPVRPGLSDEDKQVIAGAIDRCAEIDPEQERIRQNQKTIMERAAGRDAAVQYILDYGLGSEHALARMATVEALGFMGREIGAEMRPRVLEALESIIEFDGSYSVRRHAARTVAGFGDRELLLRLYREVPDFDGSVRRSILANERGQLPSLGATISRVLRRFPVLMEALEGRDLDKSARARAELQRLTGDYDRAETADWLRWWKENQDKIKDGPDEKLFGNAVNVTADRSCLMALIDTASLIGARTSVDGLCYMVDHGTVSEKMAACAALGSVGGDEAVAKLRQALQCPDGWVKATAAKALVEIDPRSAAAELRPLLEDWAPDDRSAGHRTALLLVRRAAVAGLAAAGARDVAPRLGGMLVDGDCNRQLGWDLVAALHRLGGSGELPALAVHAARCVPRERKAAVEAIAAICGREAPPAALKGRGLSEAQPAELRRLAVGGDPAAAVAAVSEMGRRSLTGEGDGLMGVLKDAGVDAARMLCLALLAERKWSPAVAQMGRMALACGENRAVACAALAAAAEVGRPEAVDVWLKAAAARPDASAAADLEKLRREAAAAVAGLASTPGLSLEVAVACAQCLPALAFAGATPDDVRPERAFGGDAALQLRARGALVGMLGNQRLRGAVPAVCAALRRLSGEDYPDDPAIWQRWWGRQGR